MMLSLTKTRSFSQSARSGMLSIWLMFMHSYAFASPPSKTPDYGVRYTLEKLTTGDSTPIAVLMPRPARLSGEDMQTLVKGVFDQMKRSASSRYGASSIAFKQDGEGSVEVYVWLDKAKAPYHDQLIAETVHTFSELGVPAVQFPEVKMEAVSRKDLSFATFSLTLPPWQALAVNSPHVWTELSNGVRISTHDFHQKLSAADAQAIASLWVDFERSDQAASSVLKTAHRLRLKDRQPRCRSAVESADPNLRVSAVECLIYLDEPESAEAILATTLTEDPEESVQKATLALLKTSAHTSHQRLAYLHQLSFPDPAEIQAAIEALVTLESPKINLALQTLIKHPSADIRQTARNALAKRGAASMTTKILSNASVSSAIRIESALTLLDAASEQKLALRFLAKNGDHQHWGQILPYLGKLKLQDKRDVLEHALKNQNQKVVGDALARFSGHADLESLKRVLAFEPEDEQIKTAQTNTIGRICEQLDTKVLLKQAQTTDLRLKGCAINTLSRLAQKNRRLKKKLLPLLTKLAQHKTEQIRSLALQGLGDLADKKSFQLIKEKLGDPSVSVVAAATGALRNYENTETEALVLKQSEHANPMVIAQVCRVFGVRAYASGVTFVLAQSDRPELPIRIESTRALLNLIQLVEKPKTSFEFFSMRLNDLHPDVRRLALRGLSLSDDPRRIEAISSLSQDTDIGVQTLSLELLGNTQDQRAVEAVGSGLAHTNPVVRKAAITALIKLGGEEAKVALKNHQTQEQDPTLLKLIETKTK